MNLKINIEIMDNCACLDVYSSFDCSDRDSGKCVHPLLKWRGS